MFMPNTTLSLIFNSSLILDLLNAPWILPMTALWLDVRQHCWDVEMHTEWLFRFSPDPLWRLRSTNKNISFFGQSVVNWNVAQHFYSVLEKRVSNIVEVVIEFVVSWMFLIAWWRIGEKMRTTVLFHSYCTDSFNVCMWNCKHVLPTRRTCWQQRGTGVVDISETNS